MYLLEAFHLVQFFLLPGDTIKFHSSTGIVAPNGSGKSAILDALQIVLHGGDQKKIDLNAQSGGASGERGRTIREYCLGYYAGDHHVRENATTFLTMVFRDDKGKLSPVSAGIALGASDRDPTLHVYGRYVANVDLALTDHFEAPFDEKIPLSWKAFKEVIEDRAAAAGGKVEYPKTASEHVETMLFSMRPTGSISLDPRAFTRALKNALNLKTVPDASAFVRDHIIDARPIDLKEFRHQLDTFRRLESMVADCLTRIDRCKEMQERAGKAISARMHAATYTAMTAEFERDVHMEKLDAAEEKLEASRRDYKASDKKAEQAKVRCERLNQEYITLVKQASNDPAFAAARNNAEQRADKLVPIKKNLVATLRRILASYARAEKSDPGIGGWELLAKPWQQLLDTVTGTAAEADFEFEASAVAESLRKSATITAPVLDRAKKADAEMQRQLEALQLEFRTLTEQLKRAEDGKSVIEGPMPRIRQILADHGIDSTPICDLVSIADPNWAPAIEAFLGLSTTALVIEPGREDEAYGIFSKIPMVHQPHGVLLVKPPKNPVGTEALSIRALAHLIEGTNPVALDYIRGRLGHREQLDRVTKDSPEGFTREGIQSNSADVGRRRPVVGTELVLGRKDNRAKLERLTLERQVLTEKLEQVRRKAQRSGELLAVTEDLQSLGSQVEDIERWLGDHFHAQRELANLAVLASLADSPDLIARQQVVDDAKRNWADADRLKDQALTDFGACDQALKSAQSAFNQLSAKTDAIARNAADAMRKPYVDASWMQKKQDEWEKQGATLEAMIASCASGFAKASHAIGSASAELRAAINEYSNQFPRNPFDDSVDRTDIDALQRTVGEELDRLQGSELGRYQAEAKEAYEGSVRTFRSRIAASLRDSFQGLDRTILELNRAMDRLPPFTNNEKYHFRRQLIPAHEQLYNFIERAAEVGAEDDFFKDPVNTPPEFRQMLEGKDMVSAYLLEDYRHFFSFQVEVRSNGVKVADFAQRMDKGSGGEHRAPLFIVAGAAMANALGKLKGDTSGLGLIIFDELGDKIDSTNTRAVFEYLKQLGLQPIVAAPDDALSKINECVDGYIELYRDQDALTYKQVRIGVDGRIILESDDWRKFPELLEEEIKLVEQEREKAAERVP